MPPYLSRHQLKRCEGEEWILYAEFADIVPFNKEHVRLRFGNRGGWIGSIIEHWHISQYRAVPVYLQHQFAPIFVFLESTNSAADEHKETSGWFS